MDKIKYAFFVGLLLILSSCGGYREGVIQSDSKSYLHFTGNIEDTIVSIDNIAPFSLGSDSDNIHYQISPGKHSIIVKRGSKLIVNRDIFLGKGLTKEINIK